MITVLFSCESCGLTDVACPVQAREGHEDVIWWMKNIVGPSLVLEHEFRGKPGCMTKTFKDVKIPMPPKGDPNPGVGKQTDEVPPSS